MKGKKAELIKKTSSKKWHVLCIDDSRLSRAFIQKTLTPVNIIVDTAENGFEGLKKISAGGYDLILVDIIMPEMDGFEFLKEFRSIKTREFIPVIFMTGLDDLKSKIRGLNIGADDYLIKPLNENELVARVISLLRLKDANSELYQKNELIKRELEAAKKIQEYIIPSDFSYIEYPKISGVYNPIDDIGGDFFDCIKINENRTSFLIADVTGHGIPAALVMTMSKMLFSIYADKFQGSAGLLSEVNRHLRGTLLDTQYITAFYLLYDNDLKKLTYTNAGHTRALYYQASKERVIALDTFGLFLGITDEVDYEEKSLTVGSGDRLFIYTDGLTELKNPEGEEFGEKRAARFMKENRDLREKDFCDLLLKTLSRFDENSERNDDLAFLNIEF